MVIKTTVQNQKTATEWGKKQKYHSLTSKKIKKIKNKAH
jgi:hypothetical protein